MTITVPVWIAIPIGILFWICALAAIRLVLNTLFQDELDRLRRK